MTDSNQYDSRNDLFMRLYEPHHASALAYAGRLCGNSDDARDLLQESLEAALQGFGSLRNAGSFKPWLFRVIRNRYLNRVRNAKTTNRFNFAVEGDSTDCIDDATAERAKLLNALSGLSPEEREALILFEVEDLPIRDIAHIQRRSVPAIKYRLRRGRRKLRAAYISDSIRRAPINIPSKDE